MGHCIPDKPLKHNSRAQQHMRQQCSHCRGCAAPPLLAMHHRTAAAVAGPCSKARVRQQHEIGAADALLRADRSLMLSFHYQACDGI